ncbi:MAG: hypothetical protein VKK42_24075 [Lyngbya sp.]|nr:hypothetical protein [Lyngbya sp.]
MAVATSYELGKPKRQICVRRNEREYWGEWRPYYGNGGANGSANGSANGGYSGNKRTQEPISTFSTAQELREEKQPVNSTFSTAQEPREEKQPVNSQAKGKETGKSLPARPPEATEYPKKAASKNSKKIISAQTEPPLEDTDTQEQISAFEEYIRNIRTAIANKADADIKLFIYFFEQAKGVVNQASALTVTKIQDTDKFIQNCFQSLTIALDVSSWINQVVNEVWNRYWRDRILAIIKREDLFNPDKAKEIVQQLKKDYPTETNRQTANRLIAEKSVFATLAGLTSAVPVIGGKIETNLLKTSELFTEMIYQIAYSYGYNTIDDGDELAIMSISFSAKVLVSFGLDFLMEHSAKIPTWGIKAGTNLAMFLLVGYTTCEYYEYKLKMKKTILEDKFALEELKTRVTAQAKELAAKEAVLEAEFMEVVEIKQEVEAIKGQEL